MRQPVEQVVVYGHNPEQITKCILALLATPDKNLNGNQLAKLKTQDFYWSGSIRQAPLPDDELYNALIACCSNPKPDEDAAKIVLQRIRGYDEKHQRLCREDAFASEFPYVSALRRKTPGEPSQTPYQIAVASKSEVMKTLLEAELGPNDLGLPIHGAEETPDQLLESLQAASFDPQKREDRNLLFLIATNQHPVFAGIEDKVAYTKKCLEVWLPEAELADFEYKHGNKTQSFFAWLVYDYPTTGAAEKLLTQTILCSLFRSWNNADNQIQHDPVPQLIALLKAGLSLGVVFSAGGKGLSSYFRIKPFDDYLFNLLKPFKDLVLSIRWFDGEIQREQGWLPAKLSRYLGGVNDSSFTEFNVDYFSRAITLRHSLDTANPKRDPRIAELYAMLNEEPMFILAPEHLEIFKMWCAMVMQDGLTVTQLADNVSMLPLKVFLMQSAPVSMARFSQAGSVDSTLAAAAKGPSLFHVAPQASLLPQSQEMQELTGRAHSPPPSLNKE